MASYARCLCFSFLLALSFFSQTQARDSKFFSKFSRNLTKPTKESPTSSSISISPTQSPASAPAPAPESDFAAHGYGLYGSEPYQYPPTTTDPVRTTTAFVGEEKYIPAEELGQHNFEEFEMGYSNKNFNEKQGMSDTRFLENGRYYYDTNQDVKDQNSFKGNGNGNGYESEKQGMAKYVPNENSYPENIGNRNGNGYVGEKQGMTNNVANENSYPQYIGNGNGNGYASEKQGMSDTRFLENGKYYYDVKNENGSPNYVSNSGSGNEGFLNNGNVYSSGNEQYSGYNNGYVTEERGAYNYNPHEYGTQGGGAGYNGGTKKLPPNEYDTMEEYEKEQEYRESQNEYVP